MGGGPRLALQPPPHRHHADGTDGTSGRDRPPQDVAGRHRDAGQRHPQQLRAGGVTPWGTVVTGEENFQQYFANLGQLAEDDPVRAAHDRFGVEEGSSERRWEEFYDRFDLAKEPNEPFRFGWGVEFDLYDPKSTPKKRTSMGRNKHEGHTSFVAPGGQVAVYTGDDERFEYAYKFVSAGSYDPDDRAANMDLLDEGTLYVARFNDDGTGEWLPLVFGEVN